MRGCDETRGYACRTGTGWVVPATTGPWSDGDAACAAAGATFATPPTGWEDGLLGDADVWIPIGRTTAAMPPPPPPPPAPNDARGASGAALPRTGGAPMAWAAGALLAGGLLLARRSPRST
jgi:hypothetical protein